MNKLVYKSERNWLHMQTNYFKQQTKYAYLMNKLVIKIKIHNIKGKNIYMVCKLLYKIQIKEIKNRKHKEKNRKEIEGKLV